MKGADMKKVAKPKASKSARERAVDCLLKIAGNEKEDRATRLEAADLATQLQKAQGATLPPSWYTSPPWWYYSQPNAWRLGYGDWTTNQPVVYGTTIGGVTNDTVTTGGNATSYVFGNSSQDGEAGAMVPVGGAN